MRAMRISLLSVLITFLCLVASGPATAAPPQCEVSRPIRFTELNWESSLVLSGIERFILEHGYGCKTETVPGETLAMLAALQRGDVDVTPEVWPGQIETAWEKALASKKAFGVGQVYEAGEGWYIPRYTAERHPDLKRAADLARFKDLFPDPEDPSKGRIYGCPAGWACGTLNGNLLRALKLEHDYALFPPGSGAAQKAAIVSAYKRKKDIVFYYWTPTALVGALDLVKLELPPFDPQAYRCMTDPQCETPVATEFKSTPVVTGLNAEFARQAPTLQAFFTAIKISRPAIDGTLGWLETQHAEPEDAVRHFLTTYPDEWKSWVPEEVAERVRAAL